MIWVVWQRCLSANFKRYTSNDKSERKDVRDAGRQDKYCKRGTKYRNIHEYRGGGLKEQE